MARSAGSVLFVSGMLVACTGQPRLAEPSAVTAVLPVSRTSEAPADEPDPAPRKVALAPAPSGLVFDGSVDEWPSATLTTPRERIWLAGDQRGLSLAIELDARETEPTATPVLTLRHPAAELPPIGLVHQFGPVDVHGETWCETELDVARAAGPPDEAQAREACKRWYQDQVGHRVELLGAFQTKLPLGRSSSPGVTSATKRAAGRLVVEAQVDILALPALTTVDWRELEIEIEIPGRLTHRFAAHLREPVRVVRPGTLLERVLTGPGVTPGEVAAYHRPGEPNTVHFLLNEARGYQWTPEAPSPSDVTIDLSARSRIASLGDVAIEAVVVEPGFGWLGGEALVSQRGDQVVDLVSISGGRVAGSVRRGDKTEIVVVREGTASALGTGACGACPTIDIASVSVSADGRFTPLASLVEAGGYGEDLVDHTVAKDLSSIVVRYNHTDYGDPPRTEGVEVKLTYDRREGRYREMRRITKPFPEP